MGNNAVKVKLSKEQKKRNAERKKCDNRTAVETKTTKDLIAIADNYKEAFKYKDGTFMDFVQIKCKDLANASDEEVNSDMYLLTRLYKSYTDDIKIVSVNFPTNTKSQQMYFQHRINNTANPKLKSILTEKYEQVVADELHSTNREHYLMFFASTYEKLLQNYDAILKSLGRSLVEPIDMAKKIQVLFSMSNMSSSLFYNENAEAKINPPNKSELVERYGYNPYLIKAIQPMGGIKLSNEDYIRTGEGYSTCLYVYDYPKVVDRHWLSTLSNNRGTITTIDVQTVDTYNVKKELRQSIAEYKGRERTAKNSIEAMEAEGKRIDLAQLAHEVTAYGEVIKRITTRVFVAESSYDRLMQTVNYYKDNVFESNEFQVAINLNEMKYEWTSMFKSAKMQAADFYSRRSGKTMPATTLGGGDAFHFTALNDKYGSDIGHTLSNGSDGRVLFDLFDVSGKRTSYNFIVTGMMGSGKSTLLKKLFRDRAARGDYVRVIDVTGEFSELAYSMGGKVIWLDGKHGCLNPLQINKAGDTDVESFSLHISKMTTMYRFLAPEASHTERLIFENLLRMLYEKYQLTPETAKIARRSIVDLPAKNYPIMEELLPIIEDVMEKEDNIETKNFLRNINLVIQTLVLNNGNIFNGHTSIDNLVDTQIVVYNIQELSRNKDEIFDAQLFSALSLCWANAVKVGSVMKQMYERKQIDFVDIKRFLLLIDESHKSINALKPFAVDQVLVYAREGRKYFAGIGLASQSIRDYVPEGTSSDAYNKIKTLFELCQYKFILKQDTNAREMMKQIFADKFTATEIANVSRLERGQAILSINGDKNVSMQIEVTDEELSLFKGGV